MARTRISRGTFIRLGMQVATAWCLCRGHVSGSSSGLRGKTHGTKNVPWLLALTLCVAASSLNAQRISAYVDSSGRVVFNNDPVPVPTPPTPTAASGPSSDSSSDSQAQINSLIAQTAEYHQMDPDLIRAVVEVESNYNPLAVSPRGAMGLMQLVPGTARRFGVANVFDPVQNLDGGTRYLKYLLEMFDGDLELSLAAYNAGENVVARRRRVPPIRETRDYLRKINAMYPLRRPSRASTGPGSGSGIVKTVDQKGTVHFTNTGQP